jgi:lysophospholipase L1-like esterase
MSVKYHQINHDKLRAFFRGLLFVFLFAFATSAKAQQPVFKQGDKVCFVGNSITYNGGFFHQIALYYATRYPDMKLDIINCGVPGNVAAQVIARMDSDILVNKPTVAVVKLGMNDVDKTLYTTQAATQPDIALKRQKALDTYRKNYEIVINILLKNNCRVILQTPTIYDETAALKDVRLPGRNGALEKCVGYVKELGAKYGLKVVDYWSLMNEVNKKYQETDSTRTIIGADRVHPGPVGHFIMAYEFLRSTGAKPLVSSVALDAGHPAKGNAVNGAISEIKADETKVSFNWKENALPFPVAKDAQPALALVPFIKALNQEVLKVADLKPGNYHVLIDGKPAGVFSNTQLSEGIDLSQNIATPQYIQAGKILKLFQQYWQLENKARYLRAIEAGRMSARNYSVAGAEDFFRTKIAAIKDTSSVTYKNLIAFQKDYMPAKKQQAETVAKMQQLHDAIYTENKPTVHRFEIVKQ